MPLCLAAARPRLASLRVELRPTLIEKLQEGTCRRRCAVRAPRVMARNGNVLQAADNSGQFQKRQSKRVQGNTMRDTHLCSLTCTPALPCFPAWHISLLCSCGRRRAALVLPISEAKGQKRAKDSHQRAKDTFGRGERTHLSCLA